MGNLPEREQQIRQSHALLIHQVVKACQNADAVAELEPLLEMASANGWHALVAAIRRILAGQRDKAVLAGLDDEDSVIIRAVLQGLQSPATLPDLDRRPDPALAAPGLAHMIHAAGRGDHAALQALAHMAEQMTHAPGDMRRLGGIMRRVINGERDPEALVSGMGRSGAQLVLSLLDELNRLAEQ